jgi:hypothetical protein
VLFIQEADMKRTVLALATLAVIGWLTPAQAQDTKSARGTVTALVADSVTVKTSTGEMTFGVDDKTVVEAPGAGTKARAAAASGKSGPKLADVIKTGQSVEVRYRDMGGKLHASLIRGISAAAAAPAKPGDKSSNGTVKSVTATSMTITGSSGGGATFTQTFTIDADTKVIGKGVGTAVASKGGKDTITDLVKSGDRVSVSYAEKGGTLHASEVRITTGAAAGGRR